jgi:hypothetical protein
MKPTKNCLKGRRKRGGLRKNNIDGVNLIKVYYAQVVNITIKHLCTINYANKN